MNAADYVVAGMCVLGVVLLIIFLVKVSTGGASFSSAGPGALTAFHDFQPKDKQEAIEMIMQENAGKKAFADGMNAAPRKAGTTNESQ